MKEAPYGYEFVDGELAPHQFESKVVKLTHGLSAIGLDSPDVNELLNKFHVPKRGQNFADYPFEDNIHEIYQAGAKLYIEKVLNKIEESIDSVLNLMDKKNGLDVIEINDTLQDVKNTIKLKKQF